MTSRRRTEDPLDPAVAAELDALEAALAGAPGADPELLALVADVREQAPPLSLALRTRLDAGVAAGSPRERRRLALPRPSPPVLGALATVLVALVVGGGVLRGDGGDTAPTEQTAPSAAPQATLAQPEASVAADAGAAASKAAPAPAVRSAAPPAAQAYDSGRTAAPRQVERAVELTLRVAAREVETTADRIVAATQAAGGYVADTQVVARERSGTALLTLRIPSARLDATVARVSKLGHVVGMDQSSKDITAVVTSAADRLSDARGVRTALLRALGKARTATEISALRARIAANRSEIARLKGDLAAARRRADLATVTVTVEGRGRSVVAPTGGEDRWGPGDALRDAGRVLEVAAGVTVVAAAALVPLALLAVLAWPLATMLRRRRREAILDH